MVTQTKCQQAALLRVQQISTELRQKMVKIKHEYDYVMHNYDLRQLDEDFDAYVKEVATLVEEHSLSQSVLTEFKSKMAQEIYEKAGSIECHAWQARFAKKHGM